MSEAQLVHDRRDVSPWLRGVLLTALVLVLASAALALARGKERAPGGSADDASLPLDQRMILIADRLQCPICEGQSVAYSNSQLAGEMRRIVEEKLRAGESEEQIIAYFVDRYGVKILREPPRKGLLAWLWITPVAGFLIALLALVWTLRGMAAQGGDPKNEPAPSTRPDDPVLDPELQKLIAQYDEELLT